MNMWGDDPTLEADLEAILERPDSDQLFPRWVTESMLANVRDSNERVRRLFGTPSEGGGA